MKVCFIGHRTIENSTYIKTLLKEAVVLLISQGAKDFLFGGKGEFDNLSWEVVSSLKSEYPFIKRIYIRSSYETISKQYEDYLLSLYEETYFPTNLRNSGKSSYVKRNAYMIENSAYCVFYYNENYLLQPKTTKNKILLKNRNSGTKIAYKYALKKNKKIINLYY